jgi:hypothetical protein
LTTRHNLSSSSSAGSLQDSRTGSIDVRIDDKRRLIVFSLFIQTGDGLTGPPDPRVEIYDPRSNRWSWGPKAPHTRANAFAAATAADGRIDLIGGCFVKEIHKGGYTALCGPPSPVDAYDSHTNRWSTLGLTLNARLSLAATAGADGRVYAVGGQGDGNGKMLEVITGSGRSGRT